MDNMLTPTQATDLVQAFHGQPQALNDKAEQEQKEYSTCGCCGGILTPEDIEKGLIFGECPQKECYSNFGLIHKECMVETPKGNICKRCNEHYEDIDLLEKYDQVYKTLDRREQEFQSEIARLKEILEEELSNAHSQKEAEVSDVKKQAMKIIKNLEKKKNNTTEQLSEMMKFKSNALNLLMDSENKMNSMRKENKNLKETIGTQIFWLVTFGIANLILFVLWKSS